METLPGTLRTPRRLRAAIAISGVLLLAATVWMVVAEWRQPWRPYQRKFARLTAEQAANQPAGRATETQLKRHWGIQQIYLPGLPVDYHMTEAARIDRCTTCHLGVDRAASAGWPEPLAAHPHLDLYVGADSPHPIGEFGCTICHEGQGSATGFCRAEHQPNTKEQAERWQAEHDCPSAGDRPRPMLPSRFVESRCLRCHHEPVDLEASERLPPPAPKLVEGYHLVRRHGCFGCHEIDGYDADGRRVGPDMRLAARDGQPPGDLPRVGPSLADVGRRLTSGFMRAWIANPGAIRPDTRMPRLFGLVEHLTHDARTTAAQLEPAEILAIVAYLRAAGETRTEPAGITTEGRGSRQADTGETPVAPNSDETPVATPPGETPVAPGGDMLVSSAAAGERGRTIFQTQGCLACHRHDAFPESWADTGPNLSNLGAKYTTTAGREWVAEWIRNPLAIHPQALMPETALQPPVWPDTPVTAARDAADAAATSGTNEATNEADTRPWADPVHDVAAFLLSHGDPDALTKPTDVPDGAIEELSRLYLDQRRHGSADNARRDETASPPKETALREIGRQAILRHGCFGCHDIPGMETRPPIGPALSDWGARHESLLAFNNVEGLIVPGDPDLPDATGGSPARGTTGVSPARGATGVSPVLASSQTHLPTGEVSKLGSEPSRIPTSWFYRQAIEQHHRAGFAWQKLRAPRSFDYLLARDKPLTDWLKMGRFNFTVDEREAIVTFLLGLTADSPRGRYVDQLDAPRRAIVEGRKLIDRYACTECHVLRMPRWSLTYDPAEFEPPPPVQQWDFLEPRFSAAEVAASLTPGDDGLVHTSIVGRHRLDEDGRAAVVDEDDDPQGRPIELMALALWQPAVLAGEVCDVGGPEVLLWSNQYHLQRRGWGGTLAEVLYAPMLQRARRAGANPLGPEAWGWLPPPLVGEGRKVNPAWLREYLLEPYAVRPAAVMRMPRYGLSDAQVEQFVAFFAATASQQHPRQLPDFPLAEPDLDNAMRMLTDTQTYCAKCHELGEYRPGALRTTLGPDLTRAGERLQPDYLVRWLGRPQSQLPYTGMPVNFPPDGRPLDPLRFPEDSGEQFHSMTELLLHLNRYARERLALPKSVGETP